MRIDRNQLLLVLSESLDCVEKELLGASDHHSKRVAELCIRMGREAGCGENEVAALATCALMHDSALNEYQQDYENGRLRPGVQGGSHCIAGESNLNLILGSHSMDGCVLYHHERPDGNGPFGKTTVQIPLGAQLIHLADILDKQFQLGRPNAAFEQIRDFVVKNREIQFSGNAVEAFLRCFTPDFLTELSDDQTSKEISSIAPVWIDTSQETVSGQISGRIRSIAEVFGRVVDYKSPFTRVHSMGVADKVLRMAEFYGYTTEEQTEIYLAGALHDIGKLFVDNAILEKPGRLDQKEYQCIQSHAYETWRLLSKIPGLEQVTEWVSYHHEKLDGTGYPFSKKASELDQQERLMACVDIYQALTEDRPYKAGMPHGKAIAILQEMAQSGELDGKIVSDMDKVFLPSDFGENEKDNEKTALFQCQVCGYIYEGSAVPHDYICPVCDQPASGFLRLL